MMAAARLIETGLSDISHVNRFVSRRLGNAPSGVRGNSDVTTVKH
jgi:hypothetical protein